MKHVGKDSNLMRNPQATRYVSPGYTGLNAPYYTTISAALSASGANDFIMVYPGVYNERITLVSNVDMFLMPGLKIKPSADSATSIITGINVTCKIMGHGEVEHNASVATPKLIDISGASDVTIKLKSITGSHTSGTVVNNTSKLFLEVDYTNNPIENLSTNTSWLLVDINVE